jgi:hypothetical protein
MPSLQFRISETSPARCHVFDRGRTILRPDSPVGVAGDVVRHSLAYPDPVGNLLECGDVNAGQRGVLKMGPPGQTFGRTCPPAPISKMAD